MTFLAKIIAAIVLSLSLFICNYYSPINFSFLNKKNIEIKKQTIGDSVNLRKYNRDSDLSLTENKEIVAADQNNIPIEFSQEEHEIQSKK